MTSKRVLIRADASVFIGTGHVARCLTLADALRALDVSVTFASRGLPGNVSDRVRERGFGLIELPSAYEGEITTTDIEAPIPWAPDVDALRAAAGGGWDALVVDHYALDARWEVAARRLARRIVVIDDLANRAHDADVLVDQSLDATAARYAARVPERCTLLLGPRFALIRPEFAMPSAAVRADGHHVLVSFGGADLPGATFVALDALDTLPALTADIVAGASNPAWDALVARVHGRTEWRLHRHIADFAAAMAAADVFVGAGGGTTWERAAAGVPTVCVAVAPNQEANAEALAAAGAHVYLGRVEALSATRLAAAIAGLAFDPERRSTLVARSRALVDGRGAARVAAAIRATGQEDS